MSSSFLFFSVVVKFDKQIFLLELFPCKKKKGKPYTSWRAWKVLVVIFFTPVVMMHRQTSQLPACGDVTPHLLQNPIFCPFRTAKPPSLFVRWWVRISKCFFFVFFLFFVFPFSFSFLPNVEREKTTECLAVLFVCDQRPVNDRWIKTALSSALPIDHCSPSLSHWNLLRFKVDYKSWVLRLRRWVSFPWRNLLLVRTLKKKEEICVFVWEEMSSSASSWEIGRLATICATGLLGGCWTV